MYIYIYIYIHTYIYTLIFISGAWSSTWSDLPRRQWDLLWQGEIVWKKYEYARVPWVKRMPVSVRNIIQAYLNMVDSNPITGSERVNKKPHTRTT